MFICNVKVNGSKMFKIFFTFITSLLIIILIFVTYKVFQGANSNVKACIPQSDVFEILPKNYTNVLKTVHNNIDSYIGTKINFTGYIYRVLDLKDNQFILGRNMIISSDFQYVVVGFLCECDNAKDFQDETWVNVTGVITKGDYHGDMPILNVVDINTCSKPQEEYVYPPDDNYIPTNSWI